MTEKELDNAARRCSIWLQDRADTLANIVADPKRLVSMDVCLKRAHLDEDSIKELLMREFS